MKTIFTIPFPFPHYSMSFNCRPPHNDRSHHQSHRIGLIFTLVLEKLSQKIILLFFVDSPCRLKLLFFHEYPTKVIDKTWFCRKFRK